METSSTYGELERGVGVNFNGLKSSKKKKRMNTALRAQGARSSKMKPKSGKGKVGKSMDKPKAKKKSYNYYG